MRPRKLRKPFLDDVAMIVILKFLHRKGKQMFDKPGSHFLHPSQQNRQRDSLSMFDRAGIEPIGLPHVIIKDDLLRFAPHDLLEPRDGRLFPSGDMSERIFDRPLSVCSRTNDFPFGKLSDKREGPGSRLRHLLDGAFSPDARLRWVASSSHVLPIALHPAAEAALKPFCECRLPHRR